MCTQVHQLPPGNITLLNCTWCICLKIKSTSKQRKITIVNSDYFLIVDLAGFFFLLPCSACFDVFMTAGHNQAGASSDQRSLMEYMTPKMDQRRRSFADLRNVIWCCMPEQMRFDDGFQLFVGALAPEYVHTTMAKETCLLYTSPSPRD